MFQTDDGYENTINILFL